MAQPAPAAPTTISRRADEPAYLREQQERLDGMAEFLTDAQLGMVFRLRTTMQALAARRLDRAYVGQMVCCVASALGGTVGRVQSLRKTQELLEATIAALRAEMRRDTDLGRATNARMLTMADALVQEPSAVALPGQEAVGLNLPRASEASEVLDLMGQVCATSMLQRRIAGMDEQVENLRRVKAVCVADMAGLLERLNPLTDWHVCIMSNPCAHSGPITGYPCTQRQYDIDQIVGALTRVQADCRRARTEMVAMARQTAMPEQELLSLTEAVAGSVELAASGQPQAASPRVLRAARALDRVISGMGRGVGTLRVCRDEGLAASVGPATSAAVAMLDELMKVVAEASGGSHDELSARFLRLGTAVSNGQAERERAARAALPAIPAVAPPQPDSQRQRPEAAQRPAAQRAVRPDPAVVAQRPAAQQAARPDPAVVRPNGRRPSGNQPQGRRAERPRIDPAMLQPRWGRQADQWAMRVPLLKPRDYTALAAERRDGFKVSDGPTPLTAALDGGRFEGRRFAYTPALHVYHQGQKGHAIDAFDDAAKVGSQATVVAPVTVVITDVGKIWGGCAAGQIMEPDLERVLRQGGAGAVVDRMADAIARDGVGAVPYMVRVHLNEAGIGGSGMEPLKKGDWVPCWRSGGMGKLCAKRHKRHVGLYKGAVLVGKIDCRPEPGLRDGARPLLRLTHWRLANGMPPPSVASCDNEACPAFYDPWQAAAASGRQGPWGWNREDLIPGWHCTAKHGKKAIVATTVSVLKAWPRAMLILHGLLDEARALRPVLRLPETWPSATTQDLVQGDQ